MAGDSVDALVKALEEESPVHRAWNLAKKDVHKGTDVTGGNAAYKKEIKGPELVDQIQLYATDLYGGMNMAGSRDPEMLAHNLKRDLGDNYAPFREALKIGDRDEANNIAKNALVNQYGAAKAGPIIEKMGLLEPDERIEAGKKLVKLVGGKDHAAAAEHPEEILKTLTQQKALAARWN